MRWGRPHAEAVARAAMRLTDLRDAWLNPPEWSKRIPEVVPLGMSASPYPDRIVAKPGFEKELAQRTLTKLYASARPGSRKHMKRLLPSPQPTTKPTSRPRCPTRKSCAGCWR